MILIYKIFKFYLIIFKSYNYLNIIRIVINLKILRRHLKQGGLECHLS